MKRLVAMLALWLAVSVHAEEQLIWLDENSRPVDSEAGAERKICGWEEVDGGYRVVIRQLDGTPRLELNVTSLDFTDNSTFGEYRIFSDEGTLLESGQRNEDGERDGVVVVYFEDGSVRREVTFVNGQQHGPDTFYHANGMIEVAAVYVDGQQEDGWCRHYDAAGELERRHMYEDGRLNGPAYRYSNGQRMHEDHYVNGVRHGVQRAFYDNGELRLESHFEEGRRHGLYRRWNEDGQLTSEVGYAEGRNHGEAVYYFDNGQVRSRGRYSAGNRIGEQQEFFEDGTLRRYERYSDDHRLVEQRRYNSDGVLSRLEVREQGEHGPVRRVESYRNDGTLRSRRQETDDRSGRLSEEFNGNEELIGRREWLNGRSTGMYLSTSAGGAYERAQFVDGQYHGEYKRVNREGRPVVVGRYDHGQRVGAWRTEDYYGVITETFDDEGRHQGERRHESPDGELLELQHFRDGLKHGAYERYSHNGELIFRGEYRDDQRTGPWMLQESWTAEEVSFGHYRDGVRTGEWRSYTRDGRLTRLMEFNEKGDPHGREYRFEPNGALGGITTYQNGQWHGDGWSFRHGKPVRRHRYEDGHLVADDAIDTIPEEEWP
ncbi:MAG: hypothetical protein LAT50_06450 [Ectothiorhodospiraceae bacterium]|nr:hypothetical protein [Ectothiorhodospiraceae bacterium]